MIAKSLESTLKTPVLLVIFNRPEATQKVFEAIRKARPEKLFVSADGPRADRPDEAEKCEEARKIATAVDWPCEVKTSFQDRNVGCGRSPSKGITWFFQHVEEGIILEDDCLPADSFFQFCNILLDRYRTDNRIMAISGCNMLSGQTPSNSSYFFSNHNYIWGWATWKRAWQHFDFKLKLYPYFSEKDYFKNYYATPYESDYMNYVLRKSYRYNEQISWWDYQWDFARKINSGLVIVPEKNMVINLGLGSDATHTVETNGIGSHLKLEETELPLVHPEFVMTNIKHDNAMFKKYFTTRLSRAKVMIKKIIPDALLTWREDMIAKSGYHP